MKPSDATSSVHAIPVVPGPLGPAPQHPAAARVVEFFETLTPAALARLEEIYTPQAYFKDPFNEVRGLEEVRRIFVHMYAALEQPRFVVTDCIAQGDQCFLSWNFQFHFKNFDRANLQTIRGGSHLKFTAGGLVDFHRDYWDAAEELYEKLPLLGHLMRWLKHRARQ
ncbi:MAG: nuclear transport factor 2 family protein [Polaromonas sp.]